jgi:hypothetical protein
VVDSDPELSAALAEYDRAYQRRMMYVRTLPRAPSKKPVRVAVTGAAGGIG